MRAGEGGVPGYSDVLKAIDALYDGGEAVPTQLNVELHLPPYRAKLRPHLLLLDL